MTANCLRFRPRGGPAVMLIFAAVALACASSRAADPTLPETAGRYGWLQRQRIQFFGGRQLQKAQEAIAAQDYAAARRRLEAVLKADPKSNRGRLMLIEVHEKSGAWRDGMAVCDALLRDYPDYRPACRQKAFLALKAGDEPAALAAFEQLVARTPEGDAGLDEARERLAELYFRAGEFAKAADTAARRLAAADGLELRLFLAECRIKLTDSAGALADLNAALEMAKTADVRGRIELKRGYLFYDLGELDSAERSLSEAARLAPGSVDRRAITLQLAETALRRKAWNDAARLFETALLDAFDEVTAAGHLNALIGAGRWQDAVAAARSCLARDDIGEPFRRRLFEVLLECHKRLDDPVFAYLLAARLNEDEQAAVYMREMAYAAARTGRNEEAARLFDLCLAGRFDAEVAMEGHFVNKKLGRLDRCEALLRRVLAVETLDAARRNEALYELAQVCRLSNRMDEYFTVMQGFVKGVEQKRFYREFATELYGAGRYELAAEMYARSIEGETDPAVLFDTSVLLAEVMLVLDRPAEARRRLEQALAHGLPDKHWQLTMARVEYREGRYQDCIDRLLDLPEQTDDVNLYIGFSYYKLDLPGLALYHLSRIAAPAALEPDRQYTLYSNRAYLNYDQGLYDAALADVEEALARRVSDDMSLVHVRSLARLGQYAKARGIALRLVEQVEAEPIAEDVREVIAEQSDPALRESLREGLARDRAPFRTALLEVAGLCSLRLGEDGEAVRHLTACLAADPSRADPYYLRALARLRLAKYAESEEDLKAYRERMASVPGTYWGDLGIVEGKLEHWDEGTAALRRALALYPYDIDSMEEAGYQYMKASSNALARAMFARAVDTYALILPYMEGDAAGDYAANATALRREYSKMDRRFGLQAYFSKTDYDIPGETPVMSIDGALPSQAGIEASWRPPWIGFRNERLLDVFVRVLANFEENSWRPDGDSYQGGAGLRYKPLRGQNAVVSFERLFRIGDNAEENWLLRALATREWGEKPAKGARAWPAARAYGEVGCFLDDPERWYCFLDGRLGASLNVPDRWLLTVPQLKGVVRYESHDESNLLSYIMVGIGLNFRFLEGEKRYTTERWYIDGYGHYMWGWFWDQPLLFEDTSFDGVVLGLSFVR